MKAADPISKLVDGQNGLHFYRGEKAMRIAFC